MFTYAYKIILFVTPMLRKSVVFVCLDKHKVHLIKVINTWYLNAYQDCIFCKIVH